MKLIGSNVRLNFTCIKVCLVLWAFTCSSCMHNADDEIPEFQPESHPDEVLLDAEVQSTSDELLHWLTAVQLDNGLIETAYNSNLISLYDNALAALAFCAAGEFERAVSIFTYFNARLQSEFNYGSGGFFQFRNASGQPQGNRWLGDNAWLLIALNNYEHLTGDHQFNAMQQALQEWTMSQQDTDGGLWGGTDVNGAVIGKVTEAMIDAFNAVPGYLPFHDSLLVYLHAERWDTLEMLPVSWPNSDYYYALDNFSWGYCTFEGYPVRILEAADRFWNVHYHELSQDSIRGYCFDEDRDAVWFEGSAQMAVAFAKAGRITKVNEILLELRKALTVQQGLSDVSGLPYASNYATGYGNGMLWEEADSSPCTAAATWFIMAARQFDPMALHYAKNIPAHRKFWG